jgi:hypothetical protein
MEQQGGRPETVFGQSRQRGLAVELVIGTVLSIILALVVALAGSAMASTPAPSVKTVIVPIVEEELEDLDPRDPLVMCTVFVDHTKCAREAS